MRDQVDLVDSLRGRDVTAENSGMAGQPFLATAGSRLRLSGNGLASPATIESYE